MSGYDLGEGTYTKRQLTEDEFSTVFNDMFFGKVKRDTSYKFGFFKAIIDSLDKTDENLILTYDQLFYRFTEIYWNLVLKYDLRQKAKTTDGKEAAVERTIKEELDWYEAMPYVSFEVISDEVKIKIVNKVKMKCKMNVVGALFRDSKDTLYAFSDKEQYIQINPLAHAFMTKHKKILEKMNYSEWAIYLEKVNEDYDTENLSQNLDMIKMKNHMSIFQRILFEEFEEYRCFYCGKDIKTGEISVDRYALWSLVCENSGWFWVLECSECKMKNELSEFKY